MTFAPVCWGTGPWSGQSDCSGAIALFVTLRNQSWFLSLTSENLDIGLKSRAIQADCYPIARRFEPIPLRIVGIFPKPSAAYAPPR